MFHWAPWLRAMPDDDSAALCPLDIMRVDQIWVELGHARSPRVRAVAAVAGGPYNRARVAVVRRLCYGGIGMNTLAIQKLRTKLAADQAVYGLWVTLESASVTEMAVALGLDWVVIDAEHGQLDWKEIVDHLRAAVRSETVALVRIAELNRGLIKRALDIGADGVVVPWIETEDQLRKAVSFARYPEEGCRGIGGERATAWGECLLEHTAEANEHVLVVPIIESVQAVRPSHGCAAWTGWMFFSSGRPISRRPPGFAASGKDRAWPVRFWR